MNRIPVVSSNVASVGWEATSENAESGTLEVEFKSGHIYRYADVPRYVADEVRYASSVGRTLNQSVKGQYSEERVV
jgi:hypothetical protein